MNIRALTYILLLLMTWQSGASMADSHSAHQSGIEHLSFQDHDHSSDDLLVSDVLDRYVLDSDALKSDVFDGNVFDGEEAPDCHHCCHCHGHSGPAIVLKSPGILFQKHSTKGSEYRVAMFPEPLFTFLRPPIENA